MVFYYTNCITHLNSEYKLYSTQEIFQNMGNRNFKILLYFISTRKHLAKSFLLSVVLVIYFFIDPQIMKLFMV